MELLSTVGLLLAAVVAAAPADSRAGDERDLPGQIPSLVARINENYDPLHFDVTPAGMDLILLGLPALRHGALELIVSDDADTRLRGERVLYGIVSQQFGFVRGLGWRDRRGQERCDELWEKNGGYDRNMPEPERRQCYAMWKDWVETVEELAPRSNPNRLRPPRVDPPSTATP